MKLNIVFSVGTYASYQAASKESHLKAAKRVIRYVHRIIDFGLWYPFYTTPVVARISYVDWVGNVDDLKNLRSCNCLVSWHSCKQNFISLLTA